MGKGIHHEGKKEAKERGSVEKHNERNRF